MQKRNWLLRFGFILIVGIILYVGTNMALENGAGVAFIERLQASGRSLASIDSDVVGLTPLQLALDAGTEIPTKQNPEDGIVQKQTDDKLISNGVEILQPLPERGKQESAETPVVTAKLEDIIECFDKGSSPRLAQRNEFWVLYNYVPARRTFRCHESITYTTHSDFTFLDNLKPLLERWQGPVSLAMHAPGTDFATTVDAIRYARDCLSPLVSEFVTFHVFFGMREHVPQVVPPSDEVLLVRANCSLPAPWENVTSAMLYKNKNQILYPVNVGRNVAREAATTHFILPSDIELYPSLGVIDGFLAMIRRQEAPSSTENRKVYPLSIFEIEKGRRIPLNKNELVSVMTTGKVIPFHKKICPRCHKVPKAKEWLEANQTDGLHVFHIAKRTGDFFHWAPIFIGTHDEPLYDERFSWEGKSDRMAQGYALCALDYEFHILDNAFLVHKPGIKKFKRDSTMDTLAKKTNSMIRKVIYPELNALYGTRKDCFV